MKGFHLSITLAAVLISLFCSICPPAFAANGNPIGLWRTYDLEGTARSILKFYRVNDELRADVVNVLVDNGIICKHCVGENKNKPYIGMTIIKGLKRSGNKWVNGIVLDTDSGNTYSCNISLTEDGQTMNFHAFKGVPLFGRTVKWQRIII